MRLVIFLIVPGIILFSCKSSSEPETETPVVKGDISPEKNQQEDYVFKFANVEMVVSPRIGGRILDLKIGNIYLLTGSDVNDENYGSTLWPSPQSTWGWPPPATLDRQPYEVNDTDKRLLLKSQQDPTFGVKFEKEIRVSTKDTSITIVYRIYNTSGRNVQMAPWEVTRVVRGGLVFYPKGDSDAWGDRILELNNDIYWMQDYNQPTGSARKSFSDGSEGWTAFVWQDGVQGYMLIKKYEDIPANASAPDQGEVEIYLSDNYWYIEVETQGRYGSISTDKPMVWTMVWYPRQISKNISVVKGNAELVSLVRSIVK